MLKSLEQDTVKHAQPTSIGLKRIAAAVALVLASHLAVDVAQAGSGFGSGVSVTNTPNAIPTYFANSPAGPVPVLTNGVPTIRVDGSGLPVMGTTGTALRKFVDTLPGFGAARANNLGQYIPVAVPEKWVDLNGTTTGDDYYEIAAVEFAERLHSDLPKATRLRGYVQLETPGNAAASKHIALSYPIPAGSPAGTLAVPVTDASRITAANPTGQVYAVDNPHHLGPVINATRGTAVRVKFTNYLPVGARMFLPVDTTVNGAGLGPDGVTAYTQNRAQIHLVGGQAPWVSAGTPHQWVAPAGEAAAYAAGIGKGASAQNVPDMPDPGPGSVTLYFPNNMSGRFTFFRDETSGIARLNTYAGLEGAYLLSDAVEQAMVSGGTISGGALAAPVTVAAGTIPADQIPLIFEDKTFVPQNVAQQDALWDVLNWGQPGDLWFPHVYEPNQDPNQANGTNPVGRWDYGPLFWPIFQVSPDKATLPSPSFTPEAYLDTVLVNGTAYPTMTVDPKAYRLRLANASNDRYLNLGFYVADPTPTVAPVLDVNGNPVVNAAGVQQFLAGTEVKMVPASAVDALGSPQGWDVVAGVQRPLPQFGAYFPWHINAEPSGPTRAWPVDGRVGGTPDPKTSGPDFVVIGNDGGFLPGGVDIPSQPITYEQNRRSITVTNIYGYGMLLGPGERADTIVDFSGFAGRTLILFNDAPTPAPFLDPRNDYYTGDPDQTALGGTYTTQAGYGPNTRTVLQVKVNATNTSGTGGPLAAAALKAALPAAYAAAQAAPLVTQAAYNTAFGTNNPDTFARVATGSAAQPNLTFSQTGQVTITGFQLVTSGGAGTGSGTGYLTAPTVVITGGGANGATPGVNGAGGSTALAHATINAQNQVASVVLDAPGSGYVSAPNVTFVSDNTVNGVTVVDPGAGYTAADAVVFTGGGGTGAKATLSVSTSSSLSTTPVALAGGAGYTLPPSVSFTGGGAPSLAATATTTITSSTLVAGTTGTTVTAAGSGYTAATTAVVSAPQLAGTTATAAPIVGFAMAPITVPAAGIQPTNGGTQFDQVTPNGSGSTIISFSAPQLAGGTLPVAAVSVDSTTGSATQGRVTGISFASFGSGYTSPPTATVSDSLGNVAIIDTTTAATAGVATVTALAPAGGQIFGVNITAAGSGYTAPATISFTTGAGAAATAAVVGPGNTVSYAPVGVVNSLTITGAGRGYTSAPAVVFTPNGAAPATAASATVALSTVIGAVTGVSMTSGGAGYTSPPTVTITSASGTGANLSAGINASGVGAQAIALTSTSKSYPTLTKAEQELFDDYGRYNSTGGVELPFTTAAIQTTIPLNYSDAPTEVIGDGEVQVWKIVDNGFWTNSMHFNMANVQLLNRVGWDGTVKPPASNEVGWKDTLRLNPLEDVIVAVQGVRSQAPFGQPRSTRLQDPTAPAGTPSHPAAPAPAVAGTRYMTGLGFTADPNVVQQASLFATGTGTNGPVTLPGNASAVPVGRPLLTATSNTGLLPASPTGNYDNEFLWGSAILGHATDDLQRPVVFNPAVVVPNTPTGLADPLGTGTLTWVDPTPAGAPTTPGNPQNEIGFQVLQAPVTNLATGALGAFTPLVAPANLPVNVPANTVNYKEPAALVSPTPPNGQFYAYEVVAFNAAGASPPSNIVVEAPPAAPTAGNGIPLLTPAFIVPATTTSDVKMLVQWQDNAINETNYIVTRTGGPGATLAGGKVTGGATQVFTLPPNTLPISTNTVFNDAGPLVENSPYEYDIVARNAFGDSTPVLVGTIVAPISVPLAPAGLVAVPTVAACPVDAVTKAAVPTRCKPDDVVLTWTDAAFNETAYWIDRAGGPAGAAFTRVVLPGTVNNAGTTMTWTDRSAQEGYTYTYTVSAVNASTAGAQQVASASASANIAPTAPTLPTRLTVVPSTAVSATGTYVDTATLSWSDNAYNELAYQVFRDGVAVGPQIVGAGGANNPMGTATAGWAASPVLSYTDTNLADGTAHTWYVQAINGVGTTNSASVAATMPGIVIAPPSNVTANANAAGSSIRLCWINNAGNETDFLIEESVSTTGGAPGSFSNWTVPNGSPLASTAGPGTPLCFSRANVPTTPGLVYTFRISARNLAARSDSHPYAYAQASLLAPPAPPAPTLAPLTVTPAGGAGTRVRLTWNKVTTALSNPPAGTAATTTISYLVFANGVQIAAVPQPGGTATTVAYSYVPAPAALTTGVAYTVETLQTAIRVTNPTMFGSTASVPSNAQTLAALGTPAAVPTGLAAAVAPATGVTTLTWNAVSVPAGCTPAPCTLSYEVSVNGGGGFALASGGTVTPGTRGLLFGLVSTVQVASVLTDAQGVRIASAWSAPVNVDLSAWPVTSTNVVATLVSARNFNVTWTNTSTNITGWVVQRRVIGGAWAAITAAVSHGAGTTAYSLADTVTAAGTYQYRVAAQSAAGTGSNSAASPGVTTP